VWGRKAWFLLPPDAAQPASRAPWQLLKDPPEELFLCVVEPGEVLFVPEGWWHSTWNLEDQIAVPGPPFQEKLRRSTGLTLVLPVFFSIFP